MANKTSIGSAKIAKKATVKGRKAAKPRKPAPKSKVRKVPKPGGNPQIAKAYGGEVPYGRKALGQDDIRRVDAICKNELRRLGFVQLLVHPIARRARRRLW